MTYGNRSQHTGKTALNAPQIVLVTLSTPAISNFARKSEANKVNYCRRHGYRYAAFRDVLDSARPAPWSKVLAILEVLRTYQCDWVFWTDADAIITNPEIPVDGIIDSDSDLILSKDVNGLNNGVFLIRNCAAAISFLEEVYAQTQFIDDPTWEQAAVKHVLRNGMAPSLRVKFVPQRRFNSYLSGLSGGYCPEAEYQFGDFVLHLPSVKNGVRDLVFFMVLKSLRQPITRADMHILLPRPALVGAEVGVREGHYSKYLLDNCSFERFYCIDAWRNLSDYRDITNVSDEEHERLFASAQERLASHAEKVTFIRKLASEAVSDLANSSLDFLYIDANHSYEACKRDLLAYYPKMQPGGIIAGHDYLDGSLPEGEFGVKRAVDEFLDGIRFSNFYVTAELWPSWIIKLAE